MRICPYTKVLPMLYNTITMFSVYLHDLLVISNGQSFENTVNVDDYNAIRAHSSTEELNHSGLYK